MRLWLLLFLPLVLAHTGDSENPKRHQIENLPKLNVLPGRGFDSLRNVDTQFVSDVNFKHYHKTPDDRYMIPSGFIVSLKQDFEIRVDVISHYTEFFAVTAPTLNTIKWQSILNNEETAYQIDGSFSKRYKRVKRLYLDEHLSTIRTTARVTLYKIFMYKDHRLHPEILHRIHKIIDELLADNFAGAIRVANKIVRDFGTRHISSVDVGGLFVREEFLNKSFVRDYRDVIASNAIRSFLEFVSDDWPTEFGSNFSALKWELKDKNLYLAHRDSSDTYVVGGTHILNLKRWMVTVRDNLAIIDRDGEELYKTILSTSSFRDYSREILGFAAKIIKFSISKYYRLNGHKGCYRIIDPAVISDGSVNLPVRRSCDKPFKSHTLGGFYQTCVVVAKLKTDLCTDYKFPNIITGHANCPTGHEDVTIFRKTVNYTCPSTFEKAQHCLAVIETHWCSTTEVVTNVTYRFGGMYSTYVTNFLTTHRNCPPYFHPLPILGIQICTSYQYNEKSGSAGHGIHLGGFIVICTSEDLGHIPTCPIGYTRHFATFYDSCEIYYCGHYGGKANRIELQLLKPPTYIEGDDG